MRPQPIAYASLYMFKGEDMQYARSAIRRISSQRPAWFFYDIICETGDLEKADVYMERIKRHISRLNPKLPNDRKFFAITDNQTIRPAALEMIARFGNDGIKMVDLNPDRKI